MIMNDKNGNHNTPDNSNPSEENNVFVRIKNWGTSNERLRDWVYTTGIFFLVTLILTFPLFLAMGTDALLLLPGMIILVFFVALFTAYILTPFGLRHFKHYRDDPQIQGFVEDLSQRAGIRIPKLLVAETPEINAMAFCSILGGRVCLTRGLLDEYYQGNFTPDELRAVLGHEIGHLQNGDCFKWSFVLSWMSILDLFGTLLLILGGAFIATGAITTVLSDRDNPGPLLALMGIFMVIAGIIQRLLSKVASVPALHLSRTHEFTADLTGARLTSPATCVSALKKIELCNNQLAAKKLAQLPFSDRWQTAPRNMSWIDELFSTHPPLQKRISNLEHFFEHLSPVLIPSQQAEQNIPAQLTSTPVQVDRASAPVTREVAEHYHASERVSFPEIERDAVKSSQTLKQRLLGNKKVAPAMVVCGIMFVAVFFLIPPLVQPSPAPHAYSVTAVPTPAPTPGLQVPTPSPLPTTIPTTQAPTVETPVSYGQTATVTVPYTETIEFKYNTLHRYFTTQNTVTLTYDVTADQVKEVKEFSSESGYSTKTVVRNDPNAYLEIIIRDEQSGKTVATTGFGRTYSSSPHQTLIIRKTGDLEMELTGAKVAVDLAIT